MSIKIIDYMSELLPDVKMQDGKTFAWSPSERCITYNSETLDKPSGQWALLHEVSHALENHTQYKSDVELLNMEVTAWQRASELAENMGISIDQEHIQDCLDTYREWLYRRSRCPKCKMVSIQISSSEYRCHNCHDQWTVSPSRFCRPYRLEIKPTEKKRSPSKKAILFS
jgi:hypothetical protein